MRVEMTARRHGRDGIEARPSPGVAARQAKQNQPAAGTHAMIAQRGGGIVRAGRQKAAAWSEKRRDRKLIEADQAAQKRIQIGNPSRRHPAAIRPGIRTSPLLKAKRQNRKSSCARRRSRSRLLLRNGIAIDPETSQRIPKILDQRGIVPRHGRSARYQDVVVTWGGVVGQHRIDRRAQPTARPVSLDRDPDLAARRKAHPQCRRFRDCRFREYRWRGYRLR